MKIRKSIYWLIIFILFCNKSYAKYTYNFNEKIITLMREVDELKCEVSYSNLEWTSSNVTVTITSNRKVMPISGFEISKDRKKLSKKVLENEENKFMVRDLSGNFQEIEYSVTNIDKELPEIQIKKDENDAQVLNLEYNDNVGIKDVKIEKFDKELIVETYTNYWDSSKYFGIDKTNSTITLHIIGYPENTKQYRYYLNDNIYTVSKENEFTFTKLKTGKEYKIKIEALDELGNILDEKTLFEKTSYYSNISSKKDKEKFEASIEKMDSKVCNVKYAIWNYNNPQKINWYDTKITNKSVDIICKNEKNEYYPFYGMHVYFYDENNNVLDVIEFSVDFETNYEKENKEIKVDKLEEKGNYKIIVSDFAENEKIEYVKLK